MIPQTALLKSSLALLMGYGLCCSQAAIVEFTIDSAQTHVTLSGDAAGLAMMEQGQGSGSLTTHFQGTVLADITDQSLQFVGGSQIDGIVNGDWSPLAFGEAGTEPADFGAQAGSGLLSGTGALRDLLLDLESEALALGSLGEFNADGLLFRFPEDAPSAFDYRVSVFFSTESGRELLAGYATNLVAASGTLTTQDNIQVLFLPIDASTTFELLEPDDSTLTITGQLRATRLLGGEPTLVISSVTLSDGLLTLEWTGDGGGAVQIDGTMDLQNWSKVADIEAGTASWSVAVGAGPSFYRVTRP
jgi:hypothetical protein